jgi:Lon protease-like protein
MAEIPLFPLKTVLLPGNTLELKIFETRYLDMIATCMRENSPFGVVLIHNGDETEIDTDIYSIGTTAVINDWENRADGLLGITALGIERFEILSTHTQHDGLTFADTKILDEDTTGNQGFCAILYQLIYLLPLETALKQRLLEIPDCNDRALILHAELIRLGVIQYIKPEST